MKKMIAISAIVGFGLLATACDDSGSGYPEDYPQEETSYDPGPSMYLNINPSSGSYGVSVLPNYGGISIPIG